MEKQTFQIPDGCKAITVEQVGNQIVTTFEPMFKRGDVLTCEKGCTCVFERLNEINNGYFHEIVGVIDNDITKSDSRTFGSTKNYRHAAPEEAQRLWDALAKQGKRWNPETMQVEEIKKDRWRAKMEENYYSLTSSLDIVTSTEDGYNTDNMRYNSGNYFRTKEQAERAKSYIKKAFKDFWKEELK